MSDNTNAAKFTVNKIFNAEDAEVAFRSSDNIVFKIHRKNLEVNTGGLSPAALTTSASELVPLSEDSATLELLFQYIYPRRQPLLEDIEFSLLASLAEAAEKYKVFTAMTICYIRMRCVNFNRYICMTPILTTSIFLNTPSPAKHQHPAEIMRYAARHDYMPLLCDVAPLVIGTPLLGVLSLLPQHLIMPWLEYYEEWRKVHTAAFLKALSHDSEITRKSNSGKTVWSDPCTDWPRLWQEIAIQLGPGVPTLAKIDSILKTQKRVDSPVGSRSPKGCCINAIDQWRTSIGADIGKIPSFSKFFN